MQGFLVENAKIVPAFVPIDTTGAGQDGDWVHMKHWRRCCIIIQKGAWAAGTSAVTLEQATSAAGAGNKELVLERYWIGTALTDDDVALTAVTSNTFNLANVANEFVVMEVHVNDLDITNSFIYLRVRTATPGASADLISATYILYDAAHALKADDIPTAIA